MKNTAVQTATKEKTQVYRDNTDQRNYESSFNAQKKLYIEQQKKVLFVVGTLEKDGKKSHFILLPTQDQIKEFEKQADKILTRLQKDALKIDGEIKSLKSEVLSKTFDNGKVVVLDDKKMKDLQQQILNKVSPQEFFRKEGIKYREFDSKNQLNQIIQTQTGIQLVDNKSDKKSQLNNTIGDFKVGKAKELLNDTSVQKLLGDKKDNFNNSLKKVVFLENKIEHLTEMSKKIPENNTTKTNQIQKEIKKLEQVKSEELKKMENVIGELKQEYKKQFEKGSLGQDMKKEKSQVIQQLEKLENTTKLFKDSSFAQKNYQQEMLKEKNVKNEKKFENSNDVLLDNHKKAKAKEIDNSGMKAPEVDGKKPDDKKNTKEKKYSLNGANYTTYNYSANAVRVEKAVLGDSGEFKNLLVVGNEFKMQETKNNIGKKSVNIVEPLKAKKTSKSQYDDLTINEKLFKKNKVRSPLNKLLENKPKNQIYKGAKNKNRTSINIGSGGNSKEKSKENILKLK